MCCDRNGLPEDGWASFYHGAADLGEELGGAERDERRGGSRA